MTYLIVLQLYMSITVTPSMDECKRVAAAVYQTTRMASRNIACYDAASRKLTIVEKE